jgi:undecaprenyl-diphosphatase
MSTLKKIPTGWVFLAALASLAATVLFLTIGLCIRSDTGLTRIDGIVEESLQTVKMDSPGLTSFFQSFTRLGSWRRLTVFVALVGLLLLWRRHYWLLAAWVSVIGGGALLERELKELWQRPRPGYAGSFASWSFPSGHAMAAALVCAMTVYLLVQLAPQRSRALWAGVALATVTLLISFSRIYLGQHYLSDVVAGLAAGLGWVAAWVGAIEALRRRAATQSASFK